MTCVVCMSGVFVCVVCECFVGMCGVCVSRLCWYAWCV